MKFQTNRWMLPIWFSIFAVFMGATVAILTTTGCKKKAADPMPASGAVAGWEKTADTRVFDAKNLYQYIDGDAEQYISAGVVTTSTADYKYKGQLEATADVYTMGSWKPRWTFTPWAMPRARAKFSKPDRPRTPKPSNSAMPESPTRRA